MLQGFRSPPMHPEILPGDAHVSGWLTTLPAAEATPALSGEHTADWTVIGAGFMGLACARRLGEFLPNARILLIDAARLGMGPAGRNSGFAVDTLTYDTAPDGERARRIARILTAGVDWLRDTVRAEKIDCDWDDQGRVIAAANDHGLRCLKPIAKGFELVGRPVKHLEAEDMRRITGSDFYKAGLHYTGTALLQPVALLRGLTKGLPENVTLFEDSPVLHIEPGEPIRVSLANGSVRTKNLALCSNIFLPQFGIARNRYAFVATFASLTRPLNEAETAAVGGEAEWGITPSFTGMATVRRTHDNRILMRHMSSYQPLNLAADLIPGLREHHGAAIAARWPGLEGIEIDQTWGGTCSFTRNDGQVFGRVAPNVFASSACFGIGVSLGSISGRLLAEYALGDESDLLREKLRIPSPSYVPPDPLLRFFATRKIRKAIKQAPRHG